MEAQEQISCGKVGLAGWHQYAIAFVDFLTVRPEPQEIQQPATPPPGERFPRDTKRLESGLAGLPFKLLLAIFSELDTLAAFSLSLTCERLFVVGWPVVQRMDHARIGRWAGARLICVGDYQDSKSAGPGPPGFLTAAKRAEIAEGSENDEHASSSDEREDGKCRKIAPSGFPLRKVKRKPFRGLHSWASQRLEAPRMRPPDMKSMDGVVDPDWWWDDRSALRKALFLGWASHLPSRRFTEVASFLGAKTTDVYAPNES